MKYVVYEVEIGVEDFEKGDGKIINQNWIVEAGIEGTSPTEYEVTLRKISVDGGEDLPDEEINSFPPDLREYLNETAIETMLHYQSKEIH